MREAHEEPCTEEGEHRQLVRDELILAAAQCILWFGQGLFKQVLFPGKVDPHEMTHSLRPGVLFPGEGGLSLERWRFWRCGFASVMVASVGGEKGGHGRECERVSKTAARLMMVLEETMTL